MLTSLRSRLWLSYSVVIATALTLVAISMFVFLLRSPAVYRESLTRLQIAEKYILARSDQFISSAHTDEQFIRLSESLDVRIVILGADRSVLLDTKTSQSPLIFAIKKPAARGLPVLRDGDGSAWFYRASMMDNGNTLLVATPRPRVPLVNIFKDELLTPLLRGGAVALLLSLVLAFLISRWVADPLQKVVVAARVYPSQPAHFVPEDGPREVRELTQAFNSMIGRVQNSQQSQREFVANVSHELKTPLTSIQGFAQAILDGTADTPESRTQAAQVIFTEAGRMHRLVTDLLSLARLDAGTADLKVETIEAQSLLNGVAEKFTPLAKQAGIELHIEVLPGLPSFEGDGDRLAQVFTNLVDNALKFTPSGGEIWLRAENAPKGIRFLVRDTGKGIPVEAHARVFDRFFQLDGARTGGEKHGAGLGLAIAREIIEAHGGRIAVRSSVEQGTTFELTLPLAQREKSKPNRSQS